MLKTDTLVKLGYLFAGFNISFGQYTLISPDGLKDVWCPEICFQPAHSEFETKHCCACDGLPDFEMPHNNTNLTNVLAEILNVERTKYKITTFNSVVSIVQDYQFIYTKQDLRRFPENLCSFNLVKIDVSHNLITEIGRISCLKDLDSLVMTNNRITSLSNKSFMSLSKLRYVDLSFNMISSMDYNVFQASDVFTLLMDGNNLDELDISNIFKFNKTACKSSYSNAQRDLKITNIANFQFEPEVDKNTLCTDSFFSNTTLDVQPLHLFTQEIEFRTIYDYYPCGRSVHDGTAYNCDCELGEYLHLALIDIFRVFWKQENLRRCSSPDALINVPLEEVYYNQTLRDLMICDIVDFCPKIGNCKCTCTSQPSRGIFIVDCSNQTCTDFPEVVPDTKHDIILNMSYNMINHIHARKTYFSKVKVLDLRGNVIQEIKNDISVLTKATDVIIPDHRLSDLPKSIQSLNPNVFHFGNGGIPCSCDNRWIGEWRSIKSASKQYPFALYCSNFNGHLFEDSLNQLLECDMEEKDLKTYFVLSGLLFLFLLSLILIFFFRYEISIARRLLQSKSLKREEWEIDAYISFDDSNEEIRSYVLKDLDTYLKKSKLSTFIPCRDACFGSSEEENVRTNMHKCKYVLILQTKGMYISLGNFQTKRFEYSLAWNLLLSTKLAKVYIIKFEKGMDKYMSLKSRALKRCGLSFNICERKRSLYVELLKAFDEPIIGDWKHQFRKQMWKGENLQTGALSAKNVTYVMPRVD